MEVLTRTGGRNYKTCVGRALRVWMDVPKWTKMEVSEVAILKRTLTTFPLRIRLIKSENLDYFVNKR